LGFLPVAVVSKIVHKYKINNYIHGEKQYTIQYSTQYSTVHNTIQNHRTHKMESKKYKTSKQT